MAAANGHRTVVGVFTANEQAQRAVSELRRMGFKDSEIGVARRDESGRGDDTARGASGQGASGEDNTEGHETYAAEGTAAGVATGVGVGALWGLGILAGVLPAIGPAIAGGTLAAILSSAAAGAAAAGLGGTLIGLGLSKDEADYYDQEFKAGRTVVTVTAKGREIEAEAILSQFGGYDISHESGAGQGMTGQATAGKPGLGGRGMSDLDTDDLTTDDLATHDQAMGVGFGGGTLGGTGSSALTGEGPTGDENPAWPASTRSSAQAGSLWDQNASETADFGQESLGRRDRTSADESRFGDETSRMTAYEEELDIDKRRVDKGEVNIRKEVSTEHKTIDVPVQREEVVIERRPASGERGGTIGESGHEEIRIPVSEEQVEVTKQTVAKEDVVVGKRTVQDTQRVDETLRKEEIKIDSDDETRTNIKDDRNRR